MSSRTFRLPFTTDIQYKGMNFLIMDSPSKDSISYFIEVCHRMRVTDIVRVCEDRYPILPFKEAGIEIHHWEFDDGSAPPEHILAAWFDLLKNRFYVEKKTTSNPETFIPGPVAVHCIAGYGRAPVLVAVALIELGMYSADAIELIRSKRKGAFNDRQIDYLTKYTPRNRLRRSSIRCAVM